MGCCLVGEGQCKGSGDEPDDGDCFGTGDSHGDNPTRGPFGCGLSSVRATARLAHPARVTSAAPWHDPRRQPPLGGGTGFDLLGRPPGKRHPRACAWQTPRGGGNGCSVGNDGSHRERAESREGVVVLPGEDGVQSPSATGGPVDNSTMHHWSIAPRRPPALTREQERSDEPTRPRDLAIPVAAQG